MSHKITLSPSGRSFRVDEGETILEAALRSGLSVNYHCANGSCGGCRARIVDGEVSKHLHSDFIYKGAERHQPMMLICRAIPAGDMVIEMQEGLSTDDIPQQQITATVTRLDRLNDEVMDVQLRTPRSQTLRFLAGQSVTLQFGDLPPRNKSIASCPCNGRDLQFHFKHSAGDAFSQYVFESMSLKDKIDVIGPDGDFVLDEHSGHNLLFIAYETGFAPLKSLIEHAISLESPVDIRLLWFAQGGEGHYQENYCRAWKDVLENFDYNLVTLDLDDIDSGVADESLRAALSSVLLTREKSGEMDVYMAAPEALLNALQERLEDYPVHSVRMMSNNL